jgi:hypothetical protein
MKIYHYLLSAATLILSGVYAHGGDLAEQRQRLRELPAMQSALDRPEENPVLRRTAFRQILKTREAEPAAIRALGDRDEEIRKAAVYLLRSRPSSAAEEALIRAGGDENAEVRYLAVLSLRERPSSESRNFLKTVAARESDPRIRKAALGTPILSTGNRRLLRDDPFWDYDIVKVGALPIPESTLKFQTDPIADGQSKGYQEAGFNDSAWKPIKFGAWQGQGYPEYRGTGWYRVRFDMAAKTEHNAVELFLPEVGGSAWVWLNGVFVGESKGERTVRLDVTAEINWNGANELAVRVDGNDGPGGLLKPLTIEIFK